MAFSVSAFGVHKDSLPAGWGTGRLDTLALLNPEQINDDYPHEEILYLDIANVGPGKVGEPVRMPLAEAPSRAKRIVRAGDSILSTVRPGNRAYAFLRQPPGNLVVSTGFVVLRAKPTVAEPRFVYYLATSEALIEYLAAIAEEKTAYPSVNPGDIAECPVPIPPLPEQRAIAHILGALDDKIELNRRMNETLEQMAQAIFKSWFVDFDPVKAKAAGKQPVGMDATTAALFPGSFEESSLCEIPKGWDARPLDAVADFLNGLALQKYPPENDDYLPVIKIAELRSGVSSSSGRASVAIPSEYVVDDGDVLFSWSGSLEVVIWCGGKGALNQHLFKVTSRKYPKWFYYFWVKQHLPAFRAIASDKATTMGHIRRHHLREALVVVPPQPIVDAADRVMSPLLARFVGNCQESRTLAAIRDALLPKLMSGEIRVKDAERFLEQRPEPGGDAS